MNTALLALLLLACGAKPTAADAVTAAETSLSAQDYAGAIANAKQGLNRHPETKDWWRLEFIALEALARSGDAAAVTAKLASLSEANGSPIKGTHYVSTADQLKASGAGTDAIELLDQGRRRFPNDPDIQRALEQAKASGGTDELEALKSLGYLGE